MSDSSMSWYCSPSSASSSSSSSSPSFLSVPTLNDDGTDLSPCLHSLIFGVGPSFIFIMLFVVRSLYLVCVAERLSDKFAALLSASLDQDGRSSSPSSLSWWNFYPKRVSLTIFLLCVVPWVDVIEPLVSDGRVLPFVFFQHTTSTIAWITCVVLMQCECVYELRVISSWFIRAWFWVFAAFLLKSIETEILHIVVDHAVHTVFLIQLLQLPFALGLVYFSVSAHRFIQRRSPAAAVWGLFQEHGHTLIGSSLATPTHGLGNVSPLFRGDEFDVEKMMKLDEEDSLEPRLSRYPASTTATTTTSSFTRDMDNSQDDGDIESSSASTSNYLDKPLRSSSAEERSIWTRFLMFAKKQDEAEQLQQKQQQRHSFLGQSNALNVRASLNHDGAHDHHSDGDDGRSYIPPVCSSSFSTPTAPSVPTSPATTAKSIAKVSASWSASNVPVSSSSSASPSLASRSPHPLDGAVVSIPSFEESSSASVFASASSSSSSSTLSTSFSASSLSSSKTIIQYGVHIEVHMKPFASGDRSLDSRTVWKRYREFEGLDERIRRTAALLPRAQALVTIRSIPHLPSKLQQQLRSLTPSSSSLSLDTVTLTNQAAARQNILHECRLALERYLLFLLSHPTFYDDLSEFLNIPQLLQSIQAAQSMIVCENTSRSPNSRSPKQRALTSPSTSPSSSAPILYRTASDKLAPPSNNSISNSSLLTPPKTLPTTPLISASANVHGDNTTSTVTLVLGDHSKSTAALNVGSSNGVGAGVGVGVGGGLVSYRIISVLVVGWSKWTTCPDALHGSPSNSRSTSSSVRLPPPVFHSTGGSEKDSSSSSSPRRSLSPSLMWPLASANPSLDYYTFDILVRTDAIGDFIVHKKLSDLQLFREQLTAQVSPSVVHVLPTLTHVKPIVEDRSFFSSSSSTTTTSSSLSNTSVSAVFAAVEKQMTVAKRHVEVFLQGIVAVEKFRRCEVVNQFLQQPVQPRHFSLSSNTEDAMTRVLISDGSNVGMMSPHSPRSRHRDDDRTNSGSPTELDCDNALEPITAASSSASSSAASRAVSDDDTSPPLSASNSTRVTVPARLLHTSQTSLGLDSAASYHRFMIHFDGYKHQEEPLETNESPMVHTNTSTNGNNKHHIVYTVIVHEYFTPYNYITWRIQRRYRDFERLHTQLQKQFGSSVDFPQLPPKSFQLKVGRRTESQDFLVSRMELLEIYSQRIVGTTFFQVEQVFSFLDMNSPNRVISVGTVPIVKVKK